MALDITESSVSQEQIKIARDEYQKHGISLARVPRKGWRLYAIGLDDGPTYVVCWGCLEPFVSNVAEFVAKMQRTRKGGTPE